MMYGTEIYYIIGKVSAANDIPGIFPFQKMTFNDTNNREVIKILLGYTRAVFVDKAIR